MSKIIVYIATSLDGFIADKNGGVDWLPNDLEDKEDTVEYKALLKRISSIIMGATTYKQILGFGNWAWPDKKTYVFTHETLPLPHDSIHLVNGDVKAFLDNLNQEKPNQDIWLMGGAEIIKQFAHATLIDECVITLIPKHLGEGIKLELPYEDFVLTHTKPCIADIINTYYVRK
jgi:dihydrofolate reductase